MRKKKIISIKSDCLSLEKISDKIIEKTDLIRLTSQI